MAFVGCPIAVLGRGSSIAVSGKAQCEGLVGRSRAARRCGLRMVASQEQQHQQQVGEAPSMDERQPFRSEQIPHRLSLGERARTVAHVCRTGTLCTASVKHEGQPFGSHVDYILNEQGQPVLLLAESATHTKNLRSNAKCSLYCQPLSNSGQGGGRCTLVGTLEAVSEEEIEELRDTYIDTHPHAAQALSVADKFNFYKIGVKDIYFVGGFGVTATWVDPAKFESSEPDPLAFDAPEIVASMNRDKREELATLVKAFIGDVELEQVSVMSLDRLGFDLRVRTSSETKEYRIAFREKVTTRFDVQSSLTKTLQEAWERANGFEDSWEGVEERPVIMYYANVRK
eukprot:CAMPEP_0185851078 /NCGR_PEP_ID=MMETSP1354-20130828/5481_1 /TAXON_ID=708628 /ORGANISM="Erythrolobus madagascarensis, Strain CCMP3276" /LENGTH=341 /DNA_ID=CAMNT_0028551879 /DNA_START=64 /DNA_END=1092 /DNA_ORIENTATION=+